MKLSVHNFHCSQTVYGRQIKKYVINDGILISNILNSNKKYTISSIYATSYKFKWKEPLTSMYWSGCEEGFFYITPYPAGAKCLAFTTSIEPGQHAHKHCLTWLKSHIDIPKIDNAQFQKLNVDKYIEEI